MSIKSIKIRYVITKSTYDIAIALFSAIIYIYMSDIGYSISDINFFIFFTISFLL